MSIVFRPIFGPARRENCHRYIIYSASKKAPREGPMANIPLAVLFDDRFNQCNRGMYFNRRLSISTTTADW